MLMRNISRLIYQIEKHKISYYNTLIPTINSTVIIHKIHFQKLELNRSIYTKNLGVKGIKNKKVNNRELVRETDNGEIEEIKIEESEYDIIASNAMNIARKIIIDQNVLIIQPYIKWGSKKSSTPHLQLLEAESLIRSIPSWNISHSFTVPLESLDKKQLFGKGKLEEIKALIKKLNFSGNMITCLFISKGTLSFSQKQFLESEFKIAIMDRYSVVIQILRLHATSAESKLQVAMAEIPYIWNQFKETNTSLSNNKGFYLNDSQKEMLRKRENKIKLELEKVRNHRQLLRKKRKLKEFPIIAIIGYTNAGKTSLIKALTNEATIQPRNQLFATLDVTAHSGYLPCKLEVIYMDTVGFMSDIPTGLIECFVATLEDAMIADVIIHVQDLSHENISQQKLHVENTLKLLFTEKDQSNYISQDKIINVGNKLDLVQESCNKLDDNLIMISSVTREGISELLKKIESKVLEVTNRKKITIRIKNGGEEMSWLYKNAAVTNSRADPNNEERLLLDVIISDVSFQMFKHTFLTKN